MVFCVLLFADIAFKLAREDFEQMGLMLRETNLNEDPNFIEKMKNPKAALDGRAIPSFISQKYRSAGENFDLARQHYAEAVDLREQVLAIEPDAFCACEVNKNVRRIALTASFQKALQFPRRADLPDIETYLCNRIKRWRARAKDDLSPESTRHARWYLARALALRDDVIRQDLRRRGEDNFGPTAYSFCPDAHEVRTGWSIAGADKQDTGNPYDAADEQFRMISAPDNEMLADHALLLSDKAYYHLSRGFDGVLEADRAIIEAYDIWLKLPYSVWNTLNVSDLNIPANYAHVFYVKSLREAPNSKTSEDYRRKAVDIYRKYVGYRLQRNDFSQRATWINLVREDIDRLRQLKDYAELKNPFPNAGLQ